MENVSGIIGLLVIAAGGYIAWRIMWDKGPQ